MPITRQEFLTRLEEAATGLGDDAVLGWIQAMHSPAASGNIRLLVVGSTGAGRSSVVNTLCDHPSILPATLLPKPPIPVLMQFGVAVSMEAVGADGLKVAITEQKLRTLLANPETDPEQYEYIRITADADLLRTCDIRIESLDTNRSLAQWQQVLAATDYVLMVLKATAILSESEKRFIKEVLAPHFGLERVALVINQVDLIPPDERGPVVALARAFLGGFAAQCPIIELSAARAMAGIAAGTVPSNSGYFELTSLVRHNLLECGGELKSAAMRQLGELCLAEVTAAAARQTKLLELSEVQLHELLHTSQQDSESMRQRSLQTQNRVDVFVRSSLKEQFLRGVEGFAQALHPHVALETANLSDAALVRKHLGGYIEALWEMFLSAAIRDVQVKVAAECEVIAQTITDDLSVWLGAHGVQLHDVLSQIDVGSTSVRAALMPKRASHAGSSLSTGLSFGGLAMTVITGGAALPLGASLVLAGQVVRVVQRQSIEAAEKRSLAEVAIAATHEAEREVKRQVADQFDGLAEKLNAAVAAAYEQALADIRLSLEQAAQRRTAFEMRRDYLVTFTQHTLPELRRLLETSDWHKFGSGVSTGLVATV